VTTQELEVLSNYAAEIEQSADPANYVIQACERAKTWLAHALEHGGIEDIVELKSQAEAIRVYTMQKQLGKDAALSAAEIVRRAERGIGVAIRKGQEMGEIRRQGQSRLTHQHGETSLMASPTDYASPNDLVGNDTGIYHMTDGITDERFDEAIEAAKSERNLSRANVVRKLRGQPTPEPVAPKPTVIQSAPAQRKAFIAATATMSGVCHGLKQIDGIHPDITNEEAARWLGDLSESRRVLETLIKRLRERSNGHA
jgi:hypothetical protein